MIVALLLLATALCAVATVYRVAVLLWLLREWVVIVAVCWVIVSI